MSDFIILSSDDRILAAFQRFVCVYVCARASVVEIESSCNDRTEVSRTLVGSEITSHYIPTDFFIHVACLVYFKQRHVIFILLSHFLYKNK